ncbi:hypothetical protein LY76DRAFT_250536 [Colletotrichum caudatum]|nr:hypothetical protein LY76DRAFT_250536 [Colletotrichum caudatum]
MTLPPLPSPLGRCVSDASRSPLENLQSDTLIGTLCILSVLCFLLRDKAATTYRIRQLTRVRVCGKRPCCNQRFFLRVAAAVLHSARQFTTRIQRRDAVSCQRASRGTHPATYMQGV